MLDEELHIFRKNTEAIPTNRGFLFQYLITLNNWLENYVQVNGKSIFCEVEDDLKESDSNSNVTYSQIKCYGSTFSLSDIEIKKTIFNFFNLFLQYRNGKTVRFQFISNSKPNDKGDLFHSWVLNQRELKGQIYKDCCNYVRNVLKVQYQTLLQIKIDVYKKGHEVTNKLQTEINKLEFILSILDNTDLIEEFVHTINWDFKNVDVNNIIELLTKENITILSSIDKTKGMSKLIHSRLLSEVYNRSAKIDKDDRKLNRELIDTILDESILEMHNCINPIVESFMNKVTEEMAYLTMRTDRVEQRINKHLDDNGLYDVSNEFTMYIGRVKDSIYENLHRENFSIVDIFVIPDFEHYEFREEFRRPDDIGIIFESSSAEDRGQSINEKLIALLFKEKQKSIILIHGDPGVGKSSYSKSLFLNISNMPDIPDWFLIHIDLKRFKFSRDFKASLKQELEEEIPSFKSSHFKKMKIVVILDGFDELHILNEGKLDDFLISLIQFSEEYKNIRIVITGRTTAFAKYERLIPKGTNILEIKHFKESQIIEWINKWSVAKGYNKPLVDQILYMKRKSEFDYWEDEYYSNSIKSKYPKDDEELLVSLPLFLYLFCTMVYEDETLVIEEIIELEYHQFYKRLIDWTCATVKYQDEYNPLKKKMNLEMLAVHKRSFNKNISLSMYHSDKFYINENDIYEKALLPSELIEDKENALILINSFIVLNYMKPVLGSGYAFEYIHKSFYEYLTAEALLDVLISLGQKKSDVNEIASVFYTNFGGFKLTQDILNLYLIPLLSGIDEVNSKRIYENLLSLYYEYYLEHYFLNEESNSWFKEYSMKYKGNAQKKISIEKNVLFALWTILPILSDRCGASFKVNKEDLTNEFNKLIQLSSDTFEANELTLEGVNLEKAHINNVNLSGINLSFSDLSHSHFNFSNISKSNMRGANLYAATISFCDLEAVELRESILTSTKISQTNMIEIVLVDSFLENSEIFNSNLNNASLERCNFSNAQLIQCNFTKAALNNSKLPNAVLNKSVFNESNLTDCDLSSADLRDAGLSRAICFNANLKGACLYSADLSHADLRNADLSNCDLSYANLSYADLSGANLEGANLGGADLSHAKLNKINAAKADFSHCTFSENQLNSCNFSEAIFRQVDLSSVKFRKVNFYKASLKGARFAVQDLTGIITFEDADLSSATIIFSKLNGMNFKGCIFNGASIKNSFFIKSSLRDCNFVNCEFEETQLGLADFSASKLLYTRFKSCDMFDTDFKRSSVVNCDFSTSSLKCSNIHAKRKSYNFYNNQIGTGKSH
ncbi:dsDNA nuclease domain-containing protein [Cohnella sp. WQ 127256]|uniref:dsDNA nuclease domain-containing protein n=1 Tax=Cohnella sp. WQ 127256 TaxID=2938790 RepID=UPI002117D382|nr:pentapeptide repeat-containing protein [Cohnella sp. WQ 127256]